MQIILTTLGGIFLGAAGWVMLEFIGRPLRRFVDLRQEAQRRMLLFSMNRSHIAPPDFLGDDLYGDTDPDRLIAARKEIRDIGAQLVAYANSEWPMSAILKVFGFNITAAGDHFMFLSMAMHHRENDAELIDWRKAISSDLKFRH